MGERVGERAESGKEGGGESGRESGGGEGAGGGCGREWVGEMKGWVGGKNKWWHILIRISSTMNKINITAVLTTHWVP